MVAAWKKAFENSAPFHMEYRWVHADGKVVWTLGEVIPIIGDDGKATMFIGTLTDITARKQAEIEKEELKAQLIQSQKLESLGRLAGGVAHDYNNMLSAIMGYAELAMIDVHRRGPAYLKLQEILKATKRSAEVTRQLLSFARKQMVRPEVFDLNEAVEDMFNLLRRLIGERIELVWLPRAGRKSIRMDPSQFDQAVVNLCINARDAIAGMGKITLETDAVKFDETDGAMPPGFVPGEFMVLSVSDDGVGMSDETLENIFEPFFTTKGDQQGTGLGLASVYGTIKQHDGFIAVKSKLGVGTQFKIYLPAQAEPVPEAKAPEPTTHQGRGETVLVVEDESAILEMVKSILDHLDYNVLAARSSLDALHLAQKYDGEIHLLITDIIMPEMNGRDLAKALRAKRPQMKCLYMSGYTADVIGDQGIIENEFNFLQKPFSLQQLTQKVTAAMGSPS